jgi:hypothetical protein
VGEQAVAGGDARLGGGQRGFEAEQDGDRRWGYLARDERAQRREAVELGNVGGQLQRIVADVGHAASRRGAGSGFGSDVAGGCVVVMAASQGKRAPIVMIGPGTS